MVKEHLLDEQFTLVEIENGQQDDFNFFKDVKNDRIQLHFCLKGNGILKYGPHYSLEVKSSNSILLYNPIQDLPINLSLNASGKYLVFIVTIELFHSFFSEVAGIIPFLNEENKNKKYYLDKELSPAEMLVLNQIFDDKKFNGAHKLYITAKAYEALSLYFGNNNNEQNCPFLDSEANTERIKKAKQIVIDHMAEPPSLQDIANQVGLSLSNLKTGFKHIYGESVFNFLLDYKLEYARKQLLSKEYNVSEISLQVGYSTASHFIAAFKKKYGTTPKQYAMSIN
ncbi:MAG: AraC family transcriptional regulator [Bacteroidia bacterium]|nr:AraC family transcriptional regulator [Bacteroidia bacterium]NND10883.1 helix-turn-helix transcriptional regulator [Flavobacteriaceae bacterium]NNK27120.1 helix-turn-helix transcriptional regulator [Flavobacteriaceae bacterium]